MDCADDVGRGDLEGRTRDETLLQKSNSQERPAHTPPSRIIRARSTAGRACASSSSRVACGQYVRCFRLGNAAHNSRSCRHGQCCATIGSESRTRLRSILSGHPMRCHHVRPCHRTQQKRPIPLCRAVSLDPPPFSSLARRCCTEEHILTGLSLKSYIISLQEVSGAPSLRALGDRGCDTA